MIRILLLSTSRIVVSYESDDFSGARLRHSRFRIARGYSACLKQRVRCGIAAGKTGVFNYSMFGALPWYRDLALVEAMPRETEILVTAVTMRY